MAIRSTITGTQIKDETVDSADIASGSIKVGELSEEIISDQTAITSTDTSNDYLLIWDATDSALKKVAPANLGVGGSGGSVAADDISAGDSAVSISTTSGDITLDTVGDIVLSADGGNVTMDDGTTTVFDFDTDNVIFKMMDDADTGDYLTITMGSNGATVAATNDDDGTAADLTFDVDGTIYLDSYDFGRTILREGAQEYLRFERRATVGQNDAIIKNMEDGMDIIFQQYDGTETLRLNDEAEVVVNSDIIVSGSIILDDGGSIKEAGGTAAITIDGSGHVTKIGQDSPSSDEVLTWDGSKAVWSAAGGGSSSEYYHLTLSGRVRNTDGDLFGHNAYPYNAGDSDWVKDLGAYVSNWTTGDSFDATYVNAMLYFTIGVAPAAMDLTSARIAYYMSNDDMTDDYIWEVWKATPTTATQFDTSLTWSLVGQLDRSGDPSADTFYAVSDTFSSNNSLAAGDLIGLTVHNPGDTYTSKYHGYHLVLRFAYT